MFHEQYDYCSTVFAIVALIKTYACSCAYGINGRTVGSAIAIDEDNSSHVPRPSFRLQILSHALSPSLILSLPLWSTNPV